MGVDSGFFNSDAGDRVYDADDTNSFFDGFVTEGVLSPIGDNFIVGHSHLMVLTIGTGKAWFLKTWITNDTVMNINVPEAHSVWDRIDVVILDFDKDGRTNSIQIVEGTPAVSPSVPDLIDDENHKQVALAYVSVAAGDTVIDPANIQNRVGLSETPFCTGLLQQASTEDLIAQWNIEFNAWMASIEDDIQELDTTGMLTELEDIRERPVTNRNLLINGDFRVNQQEQDVFNGWGSAAFDLYKFPPIADRWTVLVEDDTSEWNLQRVYLDDQGLIGYRVTCAQTSGLANDDARVMIQQSIEGSRLGELYKGRAEAKPMVLTFKAKTNKPGTYTFELVDHLNGRAISKSIWMPSDALYREYSWEIPADFSGATYLLTTNAGLFFNIWLAAGASYTDGTQLRDEWTDATLANEGERCYGQVELCSGTGKYLEVTDIQLEIGSEATTFERKPYDKMLHECMRYREYYKQYNTTGHLNGVLAGGTTGLNADRTVFLTPDNHIVPKRIAPAYTMDSESVVLADIAMRSIAALGVMDQDYYDQLDGVLASYDIPDQRQRHSLYVTTGIDIVDPIVPVVLWDFLVDAEISPYGGD